MIVAAWGRTPRINTLWSGDGFGGAVGLGWADTDVLDTWSIAAGENDVLKPALWC